MSETKNLLSVNEIQTKLTERLKERFNESSVVNNSYFALPILSREAHLGLFDSRDGKRQDELDTLTVVFQRRGNAGNPFYVSYDAMTEEDYESLTVQLNDFMDRLYNHRVPLITNVIIAPTFESHVSDMIRNDIIVPAARKFEKDHHMSLNFIVSGEELENGETLHTIQVMDAWGVNHVITEVSLDDLSLEASELSDKLYIEVMASLDALKQKDERYYNLYSFSENYQPELLDVLMEEQKQAAEAYEAKTSDEQ